MGDADAPETIWETGTAVGLVDGREYATVGRMDAGAGVALPEAGEPEAGTEAGAEDFDEEGAAATAEP